MASVFSYEELPFWCYVAMALNMVSCLLLIGIVILVIIYIMKQGRNELDRIAKIIPNCKTALQYAYIPVEVLAMLVDKCDLKYDQLCEIYDRDYALDRRELVERTFGDNSLTRRFCQYTDFVPNEEE